MEAFRYEVRHAARALALRPGLTGVAVLTLALGIGGATAIFSVADAVVLKPLPYASPDRLVVLWQSDRSRNQPFVEISYPPSASGAIARISSSRLPRCRR